MTNQELIAAAKEARKVSAKMKPSRRFQPLVLVATHMEQGGVCQHWQNDIYDVTRRHYPSGWPETNSPYIKLGICSLDGLARHDWRDMQAIKNQLAGEEWEAVELFPAESRLVDPSNYYILFCIPERFPFGLFEGRQVIDADQCIAPQRPFPKSK